MRVRVVDVTPDVLDARRKWRYRGARRPPFAVEPGPGEESVWDYPRPPRIEAERRRVEVRCDAGLIASSAAALRVCETASPPTFYFPPRDVATGLLQSTEVFVGCEWKGMSEVLDIPGAQGAAWSYRLVFPEARALAGYYAFHPAKAECFVDGERATAQPGDYYGGWVTSEVVGPFKGELGSSSW